MAEAVATEQEREGMTFPRVLQKWDFIFGWRKSAAISKHKAMTYVWDAVSTITSAFCH